MTKLEISFENEESKEIFKIYYKLLDNSVVTKFIEIINAKNSKKFVETRYNNFGINTGNLKDIINEKYSNLIDNIELFDKNNNNGYLFINKFNLENITQDRLNALHTEFETYLVIFGGQKTLLTNEKNNEKKIILHNTYDENNIIFYLNNINCLIHNLESIIAIGDKETVSTGFFSTYLYSEPCVKNIKFDDDEYKLFTLDIKWGDLLLGYGTTGKSLYHIFKDNDIKLLENNFNLSPQEYVTPNIMGMFSDTDENHYDNFKNWCIDNKIKELYNIDYQDIKNSSGYIKLGDLIYTENREDFLMKLSNFKNIIGYKII